MGGEALDKQYYSPMSLQEMAHEHARIAEDLLGRKEQADLFPVISLLYLAFEMSLRAYLLQIERPMKQAKNLTELLAMNRELSFSNQEQALFKNLSRQYAFRKGVDYDLWESQTEFLGFCHDLIKLYKHLQTMMPLELQEEYWE